MSSRAPQEPLLDGVAIIGMAGRFPGARSVAEFWKNQLKGVESISHFRVEDLEIPNAAGIAQDPNYVRARSVLDDVEFFDAEFFGIYPREAELMDPQQRLFLECCWQAFEDAGHDPATDSGSTAVYAGSSVSTYFLSQLCGNPDFIRRFTGGYQVGNYPEMLGNNLDFLATRVSYKLNLRGPSFTMQAGCSTSLLAVTQACQALLTYQCDKALAGGVSITFPQKRGSYYQEGGMVSPDGHCRAFDAKAQGTVFGGGVAVVLLKRAEEALRDGDQIYAVIRGFATNNDGSAKVGYTAPSVEGQARVIALAQEASGVEPETIGYIEAHGTGTPLGDPIELAALSQAFRARTAKKQFCAVGTAKTNVGHLDVAAGVTGLIHATHIVRQGIFPPTLHFENPNPNFDLESSPFYVNAKVSEWPSINSPRLAGVSAFGVGGTNAHVIIEQPPAQISSPASGPQLLVLSARTENALDKASQNLAAYLQSQPDANLADVAWTLQTGRRAFACRRSIVACDVADAITALSDTERGRIHTRLQQAESPDVYFTFPGQGSQHLNMAREIYDSEPVFRQAVDRCAEILKPELGADLRTLLYSAEDASEEMKRRVTETIVAQPAIFTIEYALAQLWMSWGVRPKAMLGHSIGEFVAACLAGVFSLEDALAAVAARGRMMQAIPAGGMLSVRLPEADLRSRLASRAKDGLSVAAVNSPALCVLAGPLDALAAFEDELNREEIPSKRLVTSHAFHSAMMDPIVDPFVERMAQIRMRRPEIPYVSGVTGAWITEKEATDPIYWARHFRQPVEFSKGISELLGKKDAIFLEVGPGNVLTALTRQHTRGATGHVIIPSLSDGYSGSGDRTSLLNALGAVWLAGVQPEWPNIHAGERRLRVSLPTYPFERKRFWLNATPAQEASAESTPTPTNSSPSRAFRAAPINTEEQDPVAVNSQTQVLAQSNANRLGTIRATLLAMFEELSGMDLAGTQGSTTFLELGFDSLFLTQVTQAIQNKFGLKITFRQLLGEHSSLDALSEYIDKKLPAEVLSEPIAAPSNGAAALGPSVAASASAVMPPFVPLGSPGSESSVDRLMRDQLQAMNQLFAKQLEALRGISGSQSSSAPVPASASAVAVSDSRPAPVSNTAMSAALTASIGAKDEFKPFGPYKPPQKGGTEDLTAAQEKHLASLVERYSKKTVKSKNMTQETRLPLADPRVVAGFRSLWKEMVYPIITVKSKGSRLWDVDGNEYIDILNGFGPIMLGHRPDFVEKAIEKQLHEGFETGPQTPLAGEVAKIFCEMTGNERMTFCNTGSEAVMAALRVARTVTGRSKVVLFAGAYHGMFDEVLVKGVKKGGVPQSLPVAPGIPREKVANVTVLDYGKPESLEWIRQNSTDLAAVLVEPVQSRHPHLQPREFLAEIRKITEKSGAALIFDEVVTGFRVHPGGCQALFGIRADLATYGKVLAGGMPIGVLAGKAQFMDALDGGAWHFGDESFPEVGVTFFAGTFVRHPLTLAAVKSVLQHFKEQGPALQQQLTARTQEMVTRINTFLAERDFPTRLESFGSIFYFAFPSEERLASLFYYFLRLKGIHVLEGFPCFLTTAHSQADIEQIIRAFQESAVEMQEAGFLPGPSVALDLRVPVEKEPMTVRAAELARSAPMTEAQREIFLAAKLGEDASCAFNESFCLKLRGPLELAALREALNAVIERHEALRATVDPDGTTLRFSPVLNVSLDLRDLSPMHAEAREQELKILVGADSKIPFDLESGPLVRAQLVKLENDSHVLLFTSHHMVCDGWSTNVLLDELAKLYSAKRGKFSAELPAAIHFSQYAQDLARSQSAGEGAEIEKYWLAQFTDLPAPLDLPLDRPRAAVKGYAGATYRTHIDAESYRRIKQLGSKNGCTLFVTLLSGFQALLHRLSNQNDIVVGVPTAGQSLIEDGNLIGHCVNFLPLRARFPGELSFAKLLGSVKKTLLDAYDHQSYTYGTLVRKLGIPRDPSRLPLMEVQFNLEKIGAGVHFKNLTAEVDPNPKSAVNFDLFFNVVESDAGLVIDCDYNTDLFDEATIGRWLGHYKNLLLCAVSNANVAVDDLALMSEKEISALVHSWNPNRVEIPVHATMHGLFEQLAERNPDSVAICIGQESMSYRELNERANKLARLLRSKGVQADSLVAVCFERSLEMIVSFLAVLKAGGAYVPIDSSYPQERLEMMLEDTAPAVLLTQEKLLAGLPKTQSEIVCVDRDWPLVDDEDGSNLTPLSGPDNLAYMIFTSGSTGRPKGVMVSHANVVRLLQATEPWFHFDNKDVWTLFHTYSFDVSAWEIWGCLLSGGRLVIVPFWVTRSPQEFYGLLAKENVTVLCQTPVAFYQLIQVEESGTVEDLSLRYVILAGEALNFTNLRPWLARHRDDKPQIINMYGPTEATIYCTYRRLTASDIENETRSLIGVPVPDMNIYLLDSKQRPVPPGVVGEMYIAGPGVARGYHDRPELTAERFVRDPFEKQPHARMYRSGDVARFLSHGDLDFLGRIDSQVKIHGFRIELGEIEAILGQHPGVAQATVMARKDGPGDKKLVAYFVPKSAAKVSGPEVQEFLRSKLPAHMIPYAYVSMASFPLNPNGKVDRAQLPAPDPATNARTREFIAPRTAEEKILAGILSEVLRIERVGVTDNLFELGADSLHVFQITSRAAKVGLAVSPRMLLQQRTIAAVVAEMEKSQTVNRPMVPAITPVSRQKYRLSREIE